MAQSGSHRFAWTILLFAAALLGSAWIVASRETAVAVRDVGELAEAPQPGYLAPDFTLTTIDAQTITLSSLRGQPVVLNFWATWCPPCRVEMPYFQAMSRRYDGRVAILGVSQGETAPTVSQFATEHSLSYPLLPDSDSQVNRLYGVRALPTTLFINANGVVTEIHSGVLNQAILQEKIERLLRDRS